MSIQITLEQIKFCAEECQRQQSGEMSVFNMVKALTLPQQMLTMDYILCLGKLVEPIKNSSGFRRTPVTINSMVAGVHHSLIEVTLRKLLWIVQSESLLFTPADFYKEFELIHPFVDGNGRVGAILYNFLLDSRDHPVKPPMFTALSCGKSYNNSGRSDQPMSE